MISHESFGSSNAYSASIGSIESLVMVDEDNTTPCSTSLDRLKDAQAQTNKDITLE